MLVKEWQQKAWIESVILAAASYGDLSHIPVVCQRTFGNEPCESKTERSYRVVVVAW